VPRDVRRAPRDPVPVRTGRAICRCCKRPRPYERVIASPLGGMPFDCSPGVRPGILLHGEAGGPRWATEKTATSSHEAPQAIMTPQQAVRKAAYGQIGLSLRPDGAKATLLWPFVALRLLRDKNEDRESKHAICTLPRAGATKSSQRPISRASHVVDKIVSPAASHGIRHGPPPAPFQCQRRGPRGKAVTNEQRLLRRDINITLQEPNI
jgi:hypothetical protein